MKILDIGPWVLLCIGTVILLGALWGSLRERQTKTIWMWIFGFAVSGVGIYGPVFLSTYADFVKTVMQLQSSPSPETYAEAMGKVADGEFPASLDSIIIHLALSQPVDGMDSLLQVSIDRAKDDQGKQLLADAKSLWAGKKAVAAEIGEKVSVASDVETTTKLGTFDPVTRSLVARSILQKQTAAGDTTRPSRTELKRLAAFPGQKTK